MDADVIIVGAGLSGLQCARRVERTGLSAIVLEAEAAVGGRVRTDRIDGFLCDRGFQLLNPAYPAVRAWIDVSALELQKFGVGVMVRTGQTTTTLAHPLRHPRHALETLRSDLTPVSDLVALARWMGPTMLRSPRSFRSARDETLSESLDRAGLTGRLRRTVLDTFLAGVLAESTGSSSANFARSLVRYFALGAPGLPVEGMQALPEQMAAALDEPVRLVTAARALRTLADGVEIATDAGSVRGRAVVVAVGPQDVSELTELAAPASQGLTTWWFRAHDLPRGEPFLMLDATGAGGGPAGPIVHSAVVSDAAPSYAPAGERLVQATTLLDGSDGLAGESTILRELERLYRVQTQKWEMLAHHVVPHALPTQPTPLTDRRPTWARDRVLVTGDHRGTGSIQGALLAGNRAGAIIVNRLAG